MNSVRLSVVASSLLAAGLACHAANAGGPPTDLPDFSLPYFDDFEWGVAGVAPSQHNGLANGTPLPSQRYGDTPPVVIAEHEGSLAVAMPNLFRDTAQSAPPTFDGDAFIFMQFRSRVPSVEAGFSTGWNVAVNLTLSDFTTSRGLSPLQNVPNAGGFFVGGYLWFNAPDERFYLFGNGTPGQLDDLVVLDTGFTRADLGIVAGEAFPVRFRYNPVSNTLQWFVNGVKVGDTNPVAVTVQGIPEPQSVRNLDAVMVWGGDDDTAPAEPASTMFLDDLRVESFSRCVGDADGDDEINFADLNVVLANFGNSGTGYLPGDLTGAGTVSFADINIVLSNFGGSCK